jgi:hypothetical protein
VSVASIASATSRSQRDAATGRRKNDGDTAAALPHAVAPVGAPFVYSCGGAEERKRCDGDAAVVFAHAVAPVGAPSAAAAGLYCDWQGHS